MQGTSLHSLSHNLRREAIKNCPQDGSGQVIQSKNCETDILTQTVDKSKRRFPARKVFVLVDGTVGKEREE